MTAREGAAALGCADCAVAVATCLFELRKLAAAAATATATQPALSSLCFVLVLAAATATATVAAVRVQAAIKWQRTFFFCALCSLSL